MEWMELLSIDALSVDYTIRLEVHYSAIPFYRSLNPPLYRRREETKDHVIRSNSKRSTNSFFSLILKPSVAPITGIAQCVVSVRGATTPAILSFCAVHVEKEGSTSRALEPTARRNRTNSFVLVILRSIVVVSPSVWLATIGVGFGNSVLAPGAR